MLNIRLFVLWFDFVSDCFLCVLWHRLLSRSIVPLGNAKRVNSAVVCSLTSLSNILSIYGMVCKYLLT